MDDGDFLNYAYSNNAWVVKDKKGTVYTFGSSSIARQDNPNDNTKIYKWMLREIRDTNDNYIKYTYYKDAGQIYPASIIYTGNGTTDGIFEIDFLRESRSDVVVSQKTGFSVVSNYRINEIDAKESGNLVHKYVFAYGAGGNGSRSILTSVIESGTDDNSVVTTLPATTFSYQSQVMGWTYDASWTGPYSSSPYLVYFPELDKLADVNGDGLIDIIMVRSGSNYFLINNGHGWVYDSNWSTPSSQGGSGNVRLDSATSVVDVNGDGLPDIIERPSLGSNYTYTAKASMQNNIQSQITTLNALKKKIDSDTNINTLKTDVDSIAKSTQSYILVAQQESLAFAADRIMTDATQMEASAPTLQAKIADAKTAGKSASINDSALTDYNAKVSDAKTKAQASITIISGFNPNSSDKTISSSNNAAIKDARTKIMAAQKDLNAARQTVSKIMGEQ